MTLLRSLYADQPLAITASAWESLIAQGRALDGLLRAGMTGMDKALAALNGLPTVSYDLAGDTATIDITGPLLAAVPWWMHYLGIAATCTPDLTAAIAAAAADSRVKAITLRIDSPGGQTSGIAEAAHAVRAAIAAGIPVTASVSGLCCSAAYWIASQASSIQAGPLAQIGCIGTYVVLADTTAADAAAGVSYEVIGSGGVKGHGADGRITPELRAEYARTVAQITDAFVADVAAGRRLDATAAKALATGQTWMGADAVAKGLADAVTFTPGAAATVSASPSAQDLSMPIAASAMCDLIAAHPTHAALIAAQAKAGADAAAITAAIANAESQAQAAAQAKALADAQAALAAAQAALATEQAAHAATKADLAKANRLAGIAATAPPDPGTMAAGTAAGPLDDDALKAEWAALPKADRMAIAMDDFAVFAFGKRRRASGN